MYNLQWKLLVVFIFLATLACNQPSQVKPGTSNPDAVSATGIYPHTEEFKTKSHGREFVHNRELCAKCHGKDYSGGTTKVSCQSCHGENFPHPTGWAVPKNHGGHFVKLGDDDRAACVKCHATNQSAGEVTCATCHKAYPHKGRHGAIARTYEGKCTACHKDEALNNIPNNKMCSDCHKGKLEIHWVEPPAPVPAPVPQPQSKANTKKTKRLPTSK